MKKKKKKKNTLSSVGPGKPNNDDDFVDLDPSVSR